MSGHKVASAAGQPRNSYLGRNGQKENIFYDVAPKEDTGRDTEIVTIGCGTEIAKEVFYGARPKGGAGRGTGAATAGCSTEIAAQGIERDCDPRDTKGELLMSRAQLKGSQSRRRAQLPVKSQASKAAIAQELRKLLAA